MLKININSFDFKKEFFFELQRDDIKENIVIDDILKISVTLTKEKESVVIAEGIISGNIKMDCSRCLEEFKYKIDNKFTVIFKEKKLMKKDDIETDVFPYENNIIDLFEFINQALIMEIPMKPLCAHSCAGLCPVCGENLNRKKCNCHIENVFNPFKDINIH
ncbi:MAG: DUF177 domain-containing protein [Candidatus Goldbacteria bacterium]|nr:DUF177 domain-containing protein [Candidatus Goldiibacteriota bacterium]